MPAETDNQKDSYQFDNPRYPAMVLFAVLAGMFATTFPITILSVSLGVLAEEFDTSETTMSLVVSAPMLLSAVFLPILGKMGDLFGHRKVFLTGFAAATIASALITISWSATSLISFRALAAVVGSATQPTAMALLCTVFPPDKRVRALGLWSMTTAMAPAIGLITGGVLIDLVGWRTIFAIQAMLSVFVWIFGFFIIQETEKHKAQLDVAGALTFAVAIGTTMYALMSLREIDRHLQWTVAAFALSPVLFYLFTRIEKKVSHPVLPVEFFRKRNFTVPVIANTLQGAAYMGALVLTPLYLINQMQYAVSAVAGIMLLRTVSLTISSPVGGRLGSSYGARVTVVTGGILMTIGISALCFGSWNGNIMAIVAGLVLQGAGYGFSLPPLSATIANAVPNSHLGIASATNRLSSAVGGAFGIAISSLVYGMAPVDSASTWALATTSLFSLLALAASIFLGKQPAAELPGYEAPRSHASTSDPSA